MLDYIRDGQEIYRQSFATIRAEADLSQVPPDLEKLAVRVIHACGMVDVVYDLRFGRRRHGGPHGARRRRADPVRCADGRRRHYARAAACRQPRDLHARRLEVPDLARHLGNTRSAAALELWRPHLAGSVVVIGNAPTALFHLLDMIDAGAPRPALILGFPVGFIGAAESKALLDADSRGVPYVALLGRRGGSAMAAAAVNALATEVE